LDVVTQLNSAKNAGIGVCEIMANGVTKRPVIGTVVLFKIKVTRSRNDGNVSAAVVLYSCVTGRIPAVNLVEFIVA